MSSVLGMLGDLNHPSEDRFNGSGEVIAADVNPAFLQFVSSGLVRMATYDADMLIHGLMSVFEELNYSKQQVYNLILAKFGSSINDRVHNRHFVIKSLVAIFKDQHYDKNTVQYLLYNTYDICINCIMRCSRKNEMCAIHGCILNNCRCCCSVNDMDDDGDSEDFDK